MEEGKKSVSISNLLSQRVNIAFDIAQINTAIASGKDKDGKPINDADKIVLYVQKHFKQGQINIIDQILS